MKHMVLFDIMGDVIALDDVVGVSSIRFEGKMPCFYIHFKYKEKPLRVIDEDSNATTLEKERCLLIEEWESLKQRQYRMVSSNAENDIENFLMGINLKHRIRINKNNLEKCEDIISKDYDHFKDCLSPYYKNYPYNK